MLDSSAVNAIAHHAQEALNANDRLTIVDGVPLSTTPLHDARQKEPAPDVLSVRSLSGLVEYIEANCDALPLDECILHIESHARVALRSPITGTFRQRFTYLQAATEPAALSGHLDFRFGRWLDRESMNIALQALFVDSHDRAKVLKIIGTVTDKAEATSKDDGVTQRVEVKAGLALVGMAEVPNPVTLAPFRTFAEVEQPASPFVLRIRSSGNSVEAALFEADGGAWTRAAMRSTYEYLRGQVPEELAVIA